MPRRTVKAPVVEFVDEFDKAVVDQDRKEVARTQMAHQGLISYLAFKYKLAEGDSVEADGRIVRKVAE